MAGKKNCNHRFTNKISRAIWQLKNQKDYLLAKVKLIMSDTNTY